MTEAALSLLTPEDLALIAEQSVPEGVRDDLFVRNGDDVVITVKGIQFYTAACENCGIRFDLASVHTRRDVWRLHDAILGVEMSKAEADLARALDRGELPLSEREFARSLLSGSRAAVAEAHARRKLFGQAGENVVGIGAAGKKPQR